MSLHKSNFPIEFEKIKFALEASYPDMKYWQLYYSPEHMTFTLVYKTDIVEKYHRDYIDFAFDKAVKRLAETMSLVL